MAISLLKGWTACPVCSWHGAGGGSLLGLASLATLMWLRCAWMVSRCLRRVCLLRVSPRVRPLGNLFTRSLAVALRRFWIPFSMLRRSAPKMSPGVNAGSM